MNLPIVLDQQKVIFHAQTPLIGNWLEWKHVIENSSDLLFPNPFFLPFGSIFWSCLHIAMQILQYFVPMKYWEIGAPHFLMYLEKYIRRRCQEMPKFYQVKWDFVRREIMENRNTSGSDKYHGPWENFVQFLHSWSLLVQNPVF